MEELRLYKGNDWCMVYQDFTKVDAQGTNWQDCIQTLVEPTGEDTLTKHFYHFIASTRAETNGEVFVHDVWEQQLQGECLNPFFSPKKTKNVR